MFTIIGWTMVCVGVIFVLLLTTVVVAISYVSQQSDRSGEED